MSGKVCPRCGLSVPDNAAYCPSCGFNLNPATQPYQPPQPQAQTAPNPPYSPPPPPPQPPPQGMGQPPQRPTGVLILVVLEVLGGLYAIASGAFAGALLIPATLAVGAISAFFVFIGLVELVLAWGLYSGRNWARIVAMVFAVLSLIAIPVGTIIGIVILYYLTRPHVKAFFGVK